MRHFMDIRCLKCNSKLYEIKELTTVKLLKPISKIEIKCKKCKLLNYFLIPYYFNKITNN